MNSNMVLILGVTSSGKGRLAFDLASSLGGEIISIDSMKVYRRMDVGTAKPPKEAQRCIKYHLIDVVEPSEAFSAAAFLELANDSIEQIKRRGKPIVAVGGTAMYIKALLYGLFEGPGTDEQIRNELRQWAKNDGLEKLHGELRKIDPAAAERIHPNDAKRIVRALEVYRLTGRGISEFQRQWGASQAQNQRHNWTIIGLRREKAEENKRINARVKKMIEAGLVDEVKSLLAEDKPLSQQARCAIGYAEIIDYLNGRTNLEEAVELIKKNSRRLAKGQRTWFKTFRDVRWLDVGTDELAEKIFERTKALPGNTE
jgi:tRNA dimethylallyltransferase